GFGVHASDGFLSAQGCDQIFAFDFHVGYLQNQSAQNGARCEHRISRMRRAAPFALLPRCYPEPETMAIGDRDYARPYLSMGGLPRGVRGLIIANSVVFLLTWLFGGTEAGRLFRSLFALTPADVVGRLYVWQLV